MSREGSRNMLWVNMTRHIILQFLNHIKYALYKLFSLINNTKNEWQGEQMQGELGRWKNLTSLIS